MDSISEIRALVDQKETPNNFIPQYTSLIESFINFQLKPVDIAPPDQASKIRSLVKLENARENAGLLRANVSSILTDNKPIDLERMKSIVLLDAKLVSNLEPSTLDIQEKDKSIIGELSSKTHWQAKQSLIEMILRLASEGAYGEDGKEAFSTLTKVVDDIGDLIKNQKKYLEEQVNIGQDNAINSLFWRLFEVLLLLGIMCAALFIFSKRFDERIKRVVSDLKEAIKNLGISSEKIKVSGNELTAASHEASSAVQETVSSMSEMKSMVARSDEKVKASSESSSQVSKRVLDGEKSLTELLSAMHNISAATEKLDSINEMIDSIASRTTVINDIVFKTQLLSFNASIEAAKAGEHGRGFAVVAEEVGKLADMSGKSAAEISSLLAESKKKISSSIKESQELIKDGHKKSETVNYAFKNIAAALKEIDENSHEIMKASGEHKLGIDQASTAISQIDETIQQNVAQAQDSENLAQNLINDNHVLSQATARLVKLIFGEDSNSADEVVAELKSKDKPKKSDHDSHLKSKQDSKHEDLISENTIDANDDSFRPVA